MECSPGQWNEPVKWHISLSLSSSLWSQTRIIPTGNHLDLGEVVIGMKYSFHFLDERESHSPQMDSKVAVFPALFLRRHKQEEQNLYVTEQNRENRRKKKQQRKRLVNNSKSFIIQSIYHFLHFPFSWTLFHFLPAFFSFFLFLLSQTSAAAAAPVQTTENNNGTVKKKRKNGKAYKLAFQKRWFSKRETDEKIE